MRTRILPTIVIILSLLVTGCSPLLEVANTVVGGSAPASAQSGPTPSDPTAAAIEAVIQKANDEQARAFATNDPTVMKDTATSNYYDQLVTGNSDMANAGVSSIKLLKIEWGPVTLTSSTAAQATTYETWQTRYTDGTTDQGRERNIYALVLDQGAWKIQSDDHPDSNGGQPSSPSAPPPGRASPAPSTSPDPVGQGNVSNNWSGYAATGGKFTAVTGTWTVPKVNGSTGPGSSAAWVGIGGVGSHDLIQAGTQDISNGSGTVQYSAWIETLPQPSNNVPLTVSPGDSVTVSITQQPSEDWLVVLKNNTTGQSHQTTIQYSSSLSSAEWVQEAPTSGRRVVRLDDFQSIQFTGGTAVKDGKTVNIAQSGAYAITMVDASGNVLASPTGLAPDGVGFSVNHN